MTQPVTATAPSPSPPTVRRRYDSLEGYRGLAALAIVVYHVVQYAETGNPLLFPTRSAHTLVKGLDAFVDLFFVLSAFLLALPYARSALAGHASPSGRAFMTRRVARIVPLYVIAVAVVWAVRNPVLPGDVRDLVEHLTFTQVFDQKRIFYTIGPAWSLAIEVQFYVLLAVLGAVVCRVCARVAAGRRPAVLLGGTAVLAASSIAWKWVAWNVLLIPGDHWPTWFGLAAKLDVFALGILLAVVVADGRLTVGRAGALALRLSGLAVLVVAFVTRPADGQHVWFHTLAAAGFTLLLAGTVLGRAREGREDLWDRVLGSPVPAFLGAVSYSLYLWHEPVILALAANHLLPDQASPDLLVVGLAVVLPVSLLVAWVSRHLIELPSGRLRAVVDRRGRPRDYYNGS
ncbi:MAG TPA: acyltransferase [Actinotalea sp.]